MDEPTDGLDPNQKHVVRSMINDMAAEKVIIVSTHILEEVEAVCSRAVIIANGKIVTNSTPDELKSQSKNGRLDEVFRRLTLDDEDDAYKTTSAGEKDAHKPSPAHEEDM
jgi:ABC-2 type transport system ATP-binding protein